MRQYYPPLLLILIFLYLILKPFYFFSSGLPQIADFIAILLVIIIIKKQGFTTNKTFLIGVYCLITYILFINSIMGIYYSNLEFMISALFYIFNILIFLSVIELYKIYKEKLLKYTLYGVMASLLIQFIISFIYTSSSLRESLFFNNPNQLGYYSLLSLTLIFLLDYKIKLNAVTLSIFSMISVYLSFISLSKASIFTTLLLITTYFVYKTYNEKSIGTLMTVGFFVIFLLIVFYVFENQIKSFYLYENVSNRFMSTKTNLSDNLEERRYDRIFEYPEYIIFGAGEGMYHDRFGVGEIHSTLISFLFSYGLIGLLLFLLIIFIILRPANILHYLLLLPIFIYGLTHNGLRQTFLWIILSFIICNKINIDGGMGGKSKFLLRKG